jgi:hypothetical protein
MFFSSTYSIFLLFSAAIIMSFSADFSFIHKIFENEVLRVIFGYNKVEAKGGWRKLYNYIVVLGAPRTVGLVLLYFTLVQPYVTGSRPYKAQRSA